MLGGNLTRDPELRFTPRGVAIASFSMAMNRKWKSEAGETKDEVTFVECSAFGKTAETIGQYLKKGRPILVDGRLRLEQWDDKQSGAKRQKLSVVIESFQFVDSTAKPSTTTAPTPVGAALEPGAPAATATEGQPEDDSVPF